MIGNILDYYDFTLFGGVMDVLANQFFPGTSESSFIKLLFSLSTFGCAFFFRPIGGVVIGYIGEKFGRKRALETSICLMIIPSFLIGCIPNYNSIGIASTISLVFLRLLQGFAVGGEIFTSNHIPLSQSHINPLRIHYTISSVLTQFLLSSIGSQLVSVLLYQYYFSANLELTHTN